MYGVGGGTYIVSGAVAKLTDLAVEGLRHENGSLAQLSGEEGLRDGGALSRRRGADGNGRRSVCR
jgi:hypothetical protein